MSPDPSAVTDRAGPVLALAVTALLLGQSLQASDGYLHGPGLLWLTAALVACQAAVFVPSPDGLARRSESVITALLGLGLAFGFAQVLLRAPGVHVQLGPYGFRTFFAATGAAAVLAGGCLARRPWLGRAQLPLVLLLHAVTGAWLIRSSPLPPIDTWIFQQEAAHELLRGGNPYAMTHPDIYGDRAAFFYPEGAVVDGRVQIGFPYPPLSLLLGLPGYLLGGDVRYAQLGAVILSAAFMAYARPGRLGVAAALAFLFTPRGLLVLESGWTDTFVVMALCGAVLCACRAPRFLPAAVGLLLASKQYLILALPFLTWLLPRPPDGATTRAALGRAAVVLVAVNLPFLLWDPAPFLRDVFSLQFREPFREDALSYLAWLAAEGGAKLGSWVMFVAGAAAAVLVWARAARTPSGFAHALGAVAFAFFAFGKKAFANYYYFVLAALFCAVAAARLEPERDEAD